MKNLIYLLLFRIAGNSNAQVISFVDNEFKLKLLEADVTNNIAKTRGGNSIKIDRTNLSILCVFFINPRFLLFEYVFDPFCVQQSFDRKHVRRLCFVIEPRHNFELVRG